MQLSAGVPDEALKAGFAAMQPILQSVRTFAGKEARLANGWIGSSSQPVFEILEHLRDAIPRRWLRTQCAHQQPNGQPGADGDKKRGARIAAHAFIYFRAAVGARRGAGFIEGGLIHGNRELEVACGRVRRP